MLSSMPPTHYFSKVTYKNPFILAHLFKTKLCYLLSASKTKTFLHKAFSIKNMASSQPTFSALNMKGMALGDKGSKCNNSSESNLLRVEAQAKRRSWQGRKQSRLRRPRRILMKRRILLEGSRRMANGIERRVRTLKKLVPNSEEVVGLDGLFREAADYIMSLQIRVQLMQNMVKVLSGSDDF